MEVRNAVKLKKESQGAPVAEDGNQLAKHVALQGVMAAKTLFRKAIKETSVTVEEMLATCLAPQAGEEATCKQFVQRKWGAVDLNWGYYQVVEGIGGPPQSHWHVFCRRSRSWGTRSWFIFHSGGSHWGSLEAPQCQSPGDGWDSHSVLQVSQCFVLAVLAYIALQYVGYSASGLAHWGHASYV